MVASKKSVILIPAMAYIVCIPCKEVTEQEVYGVVNKGTLSKPKLKVTYSCLDCRSINHIELT